MGSKRLMLENGLKNTLDNLIPSHTKFYDLMCGAGFVSHYVAENFAISVNSYDLQQYSVILTNAVIARTTPIDFHSEFSELLLTIKREILSDQILKKWKTRSSKLKSGTQTFVKVSRNFCEKTETPTPVFNAYGGHYFSPKQARIIDILLGYIPLIEPKKTVFQSAIISTASEVAAAPGHTAQPFQPTKSAVQYIFESWDKDFLKIFEKNLRELCPRHAKTKGLAKKANANKVIQEITKNDLVFIDPPYSNVQYSRFYHVLETIARQEKYEVSGKGRYPPIERRPQSDFSKSSKSREAISDLLKKLSVQGCFVLITFPQEVCSNGLSGKVIREIAKKRFKIEYENIPAKMSSLGGNNEIRDARVRRNELILYLTPK